MNTKDRPDGMSTSRLEAFSDGVFAVAITLLILNIQVPRAKDVADINDLIRQLLNQWPNYLSYVLSFLTVGVTWANHHQMFKYIERTDHALLMVNTLLLMCITAIPVPTALVAEYLTKVEGQRVAAFVYGAVFAITAVCFNLVWFYAARRGLIYPDIDPKLLRNMRIRYTPGPLLYLLGCILALVNAYLSIGLYILLSLFYIIPNDLIFRGDAN